jgi:protein-disulfide isomerase
MAKTPQHTPAQSSGSSTLIWIAVVLGVGAGGYYLGSIRTVKTTGEATRQVAQAQGNPGQNAPANPADPANTTFSIPVGTSPAKGPADAWVTIVEFSEFQCPFCKRVTPTMAQIKQTYGDDVRFVFKHNPLPFHPNAEPAARAAFAAQQQGKFWEFHDKAFENQQTLSEENYFAWATELGLNLDKFKADYNGPAAKEAIKQDQTLASARGATGTPAFFVNGRYLSGAQPFERFKALIDEELTKAKNSGKSKSTYYASLEQTGSRGSARPAQPPQQQKKQDEPATYANAVLGDNTPVKGPKDALVTILEYSDFECPFCSRVGPTLKQVHETYGDKVRVAFRHLPLPFHPHAKLAAQAAVAAHNQGKFWEMHDKLFANQKALEKADLVKYAKELGLNTAKFEKDLEDPATVAKVDADNASSNKVEARGTPHFFVNGRRVVGAQPFEAFKTAIDEELKRAEAALAKVGGDKSKLYDAILADLPKGPPPVEIAAGNSPAFGPANAPVTIFEFSDFECPFCSRVGPSLAQIKKEYGDKVRVVWKNRPLPFHSNAKPAAEAAMAAHAQGKFWEYHDKLFANQKALGKDDLIKYAQEVGLNVNQFKADLESGKFRAAVEADDALAGKVGAGGTPTFFINGEKFVGAQPFEAFKSKIDEKLADLSAKKKG